MSWRVRYTLAARDELRWLYGFLLEQDTKAAQRAMEAVDNSLVMLQSFAFTGRKADADNPFLRELLVSLGRSGYVALYEIEGDQVVTMLALRHQREDDYH